MTESKDWRLPADAAHGQVWCVDGRTRHPVYGVLGGSGGARLRLVAAFLAELPNSQRATALAVLRRRATELVVTTQSGPLCVHSDTHAHGGIGCGYLADMANRPELYGLDSTLVVSFFRACEVGAPNVALEVLEGEHAEAGVLVVETSANDLAPSLVPSVDGVQYFVYHPSVERALYDLLGPEIHAFCERTTGRLVDYSQFRRRADEVTLRHLELALGKLASGKPIYHVAVRNGVWQIQD